MDEATVKKVMLALGAADVVLTTEQLAESDEAYELLVDVSTDRTRYRVQRVRTPAEKEFEAARAYGLNPTEDNWARLQQARSDRINANRPPSASGVRPR